MKNVSLICGTFIFIMTIHKAHSGTKSPEEILKNLPPLTLPPSVFSEMARKTAEDTEAMVKGIGQMEIEDKKSNKNKTPQKFKPISKKK